MQVVPLVLSAAAALAVAPGLRSGLLAGGHTVTNFRGTQLACPLGIVLVVASILVLGLYGLMDEFGIADPVAFPGAVFVFGVAALGLFDDAYSGTSRGWRGHGGAVLSGQLPTGAVKAVGTLALAAWTLPRAPGHADWVLGVLILALSTNLFNILDLRPGRAIKAFCLLFAGILIAKGTDLLESLGVYAGAVLVVGVYDIRERGMLGDTGSNVVGAVAGLGLVLAISSTAGLAIATGVLLAITVCGEIWSLNAVIERTPGLRHIDSFGRLNTRA